MDFVNDRIAIGNRREAEDLSSLQEMGITAVLNVAWDLDISYGPGDGGAHTFPMEYHKVGLIDGEGNEPATLLAAALVLSQLLRRHKRVFVHCHAGVSRSPTVVSLYLADAEDISFDQALERVRSARPTASPHGALIRLVKQLDGWSERLMS